MPLSVCIVITRRAYLFTLFSFICLLLNCPLSFVYCRVDGIMDAQGFERSYTVNSSILLAIQPHLIHFHQLLLQPPKVYNIEQRWLPVEIQLCKFFQLIMEGKEQKNQYKHLLCLLCSCCYREVIAFSISPFLGLEKSHADYAGCARGTFWEHAPARS